MRTMIKEIVLTIRHPGNDGTQNTAVDATGNSTNTVLMMLSAVELTQADVQQLAVQLERYGFALVTHETIERTLESHPVNALAVELEALCRHRLGLVSEEQANGDDGRLNELERSVRNLNRSQTTIMSALDGIRALLTGAQPSAAAVELIERPLTVREEVTRLVPRRQLDDAPITAHAAEPPQLTEQQARYQGRGFPIAGTPNSYAGDPTQPMNRNARGTGRTPEMASGMMTLSGPSASAKIITVTGVDRDGKPQIGEVSLPIVGDTLRAGTSKSDIV